MKGGEPKPYTDNSTMVDLDISGSISAPFDEIGLRPQTNFKGKGQEKATEIIKANHKRPFFGNFEYSKRMQSMTSFQFKIAEQQRPATVMAERAMRNSLQSLKDIGARKHAADAAATTDYSTA